MRIQPVTREVLVAMVLGAIKPGRVRVGVDGPAPAGPDELADQLVRRLRETGREAVHVRTADFLRPASLRLELGRTNPDSYYENWVDVAALRREVLDSGDRILPTFWDPARDRATRARYQEIGSETVIVVSGDLLLGAGLPFELTVHFAMSAQALARRTAPELAWTLPAFARYAEEVDPAAFADFVVRANDPARPAVVVHGE